MGEPVEVKKIPENWTNLPKNIGVVFLEEYSGNQRFGRKGSKLRLDFDQLACSHILLQMNGIQNLFNYEIIEPPQFLSTVTLSRKNHEVRWVEDWTQKFFKPKEDRKSYEEEYIVEWFEDSVIKNLEAQPSIKVDYYIGITSEDIGGNFFLRTRGKAESRTGRIFSIVTSHNWDRGPLGWRRHRLRRIAPLSPPSVFEFIAISVFECSLRCIGTEIEGKYNYAKDNFLGHYPTRGCIFDFTRYKGYRRILVSNPNICSSCKENLQQLEAKSNVPICDSVYKIVAREWMGSMEKPGSPIYNLKRNYKYNIDRNSGFNKTWYEKIRDSFIDNIASWILGIVGGMIAAVLAAFHLFH
jgi:hypothetical protein